MTLRSTAWSNRALRFTNDGRTFRGWRETGGGKTSVEVSQYAAAGAQGTVPVPARIKSTDDITIVGAFPVEMEKEIRDYFRAQTGKGIEFFDDLLDPETGRGVGSDIYRGVLKEMTPPSGGAPDSTDTAEIELVLSVRGVVG